MVVKISALQKQQEKHNEMSSAKKIMKLRNKFKNADIHRNTYLQPENT